MLKLPKHTHQPLYNLTTHEKTRCTQHVAPGLDNVPHVPPLSKPPHVMIWLSPTPDHFDCSYCRTLYQVPPIAALGCDVVIICPCVMHYLRHTWTQDDTWFFFPRLARTPQRATCLPHGTFLLPCKQHTSVTALLPCMHHPTAVGAQENPPRALPNNVT